MLIAPVSIISVLNMKEYERMPLYRHLFWTW
jgi:hypothetical protein